MFTGSFFIFLVIHMPTTLAVRPTNSAMRPSLGPKKKPTAAISLMVRAPDAPILEDTRRK